MVETVSREMVIWVAKVEVGHCDNSYLRNGVYQNFEEGLLLLTYLYSSVLSLAV
jgi:hypothetical protein